MAGRMLSEKTQVGFAYGSGTLSFIKRNPNVADYIEVPFELLNHDPSIISVKELLPVVLHCASMSVAGFVSPTEPTLEAIKQCAKDTETPWIGEHLAFILADPVPELRCGAALHEPTTLTYTVCPQLSEPVVEIVCRNLSALRNRFPAPLIVENSPQYFAVPGSTMSIVEFVTEVHRRCDVGMLLDLTHFMISAMNMGFDPEQEVLRLPLDRLVEMHISGLNLQEDTAWDDHAALADASVLNLAAMVLKRSQPRAITFEYNWSPELPDQVLLDQINLVRSMGGGRV